MNCLLFIWLLLRNWHGYNIIIERTNNTEKGKHRKPSCHCLESSQLFLPSGTIVSEWQHILIKVITSGFTLHHTVHLYLFTDVLIFCVSSKHGPQHSHFSLKSFLAEVGFEPRSRSWEAGALSITPRAHNLLPLYSKR